jgi:cytochrome c oxidase cbb3-type subunit 3
LGKESSIRWEAQPLSYPRNNYSPGDSAKTLSKNVAIDAMSSATPYRIHDRQPKIVNLTEIERRGEAIFQKNCSFCHAADGTGRNWIGSFMEQHPRNLTSPAAMSGMTETRMAAVIREGLPGTSMSAWKSVLSDVEIESVIAYINRAFYVMTVK